MSNTMGRVNKKINHKKGIAAEAKDKRRSDARERQALYDVLTPQQKIARLDQAFGTGVGAVRERARLARAVQSKQDSAAPAPAKKKDHK